MKTYKNINYSATSAPECLLDFYLPEAGDFNIFIYLHGGGLEGGDKSCEGELLSSYLCPRGIGVVSVNYRMYPKAKYPVFIEDAAEAVAWVYHNMKPYPLCKKIFVGGSSAGGYLSMMLCFDPKYLGKHGIKPTDIDGYVHDAGQPTVHFNVCAERGMDGRRILVDEAAPIYHVGTAERYSPMLFVWSDQDMTNRPEQLTLMISTLEHFGYDMTKIDTLIAHGKHVHYLSEVDNKGDNLFATMIYPFIKKHS